MALTVLEVLQNAEYNLKNGTLPFQKELAVEQLSNAIKQLEDDGDAYKDFVEGYGMSNV